MREDGRGREGRKEGEEELRWEKMRVKGRVDIRK